MAELKILYNQDIFDLANKTGYSIDNVYKLIGENSFITSIDYDLNANPGQSIEYDPAFKKNQPQILFQKASAVSSPSRQIKAKEGQSIFDIALMSVGVEKLMALIKSNNIANIDITELEGKIFNFSVTDVKDKGFYNRKLEITTGDLFKDQYLLAEDGGFLLQENGEKIILEF